MPNDKDIKWDVFNTKKIPIDDAVLANISWQIRKLRDIKEYIDREGWYKYANTLDEAKARAQSIVDSINEIDMEASE